MSSSVLHGFGRGCPVPSKKNRDWGSQLLFQQFLILRSKMTEVAVPAGVGFVLNMFATLDNGKLSELQIILSDV